MIAFLCSNCGTELRVKDALAGTRGKCPRCKQSIEAPTDSSPGEIPIALPSKSGGSRAPDKPTHPEADLAETAPSLPPSSGAGSGEVFESDAAHSAKDLAFLAPPEGPGELGRIAHYRVLKVLGSGGMGIVFQAEDLQLKRPVALKCMKARLAAKQGDRQRFLREAQATAAIDHEHIVTIYQVGEHRGIPFLAMKLLRGESLEERLNKRGGRLPLPDVLRIGQEVAEGLAAAHAQGLIHRDIKPANIWLEEGRDWVRIVDFGLARAPSEGGHLTQAGMIIGTPAYMAPEQANAEPLDSRCDLFSLGCVLYRMSTGQLPFKGKNTLAMLLALAAKNPPPPHTLNSSLPFAFSEVVLKLLEKDRDDRPPSARAVWEALEQVKQDIAGEGGSTSPVTWPTPAKVPAAPPDELEEVESMEEVVDLEVVEEATRKSAAKRRSETRKKKPRRTKQEENELERKVMKLAMFVAIAVVLLILFLIVRHVFLKPSAPADTSLLWPDARTVLAYCRPGDAPQMEWPIQDPRWNCVWTSPERQRRRREVPSLALRACPSLAPREGAA